ncbi:hypothetical protein V6N13_143771 [Hibiscus sabdariffa]
MAPPIPTQSSESDEAAFGPWMLVEKQQRRTGRMPQSVVPKHNERHAMGSRFNPIMEIQEDTLVRWEEDNSRRTNGVTESAIVYKQQGKFGTGAKQPRTLPVHKPLMIIDFPITSKATPKASISRTTPGKSGSVVLEKSRHSTVVISENSNPNCPSMDVDLDVNPTCPNSLVRGKPPDSCASLPAGTNMATLQTVQDVMIAKGAMPAAMQVNDMLDWPLGFPYSHRIEANGFSGGIWIDWFESFNVDIILNHFQFVHCRITDKRCGSSVLATVVYGSPNATKRKALWTNLHHLALSINLPWVLFGDFNATLFATDRANRSSSMKPYSSVQHLLRMKSGHRPIFLQVNGTTRRSFKPPFWYLSSWSSHDDFGRMVADNRVPLPTLSETITSFTKAADTWNNTVYGYIGKKKRIVMARLCGIQKALCVKTSRFLMNLESELLLELEHILNQEELLWRQKCCSDWIALGDRNTQYFHMRAISRKQKKHITYLQLLNGEWCSDADSLRAEAASFFKSLFTANMRPLGWLPIHGCFPRLPQDAMSSLDVVPPDQEIYDALMEMACIPSFTKNNGKTVGPSVCCVIQQLEKIVGGIFCFRPEHMPNFHGSLAHSGLTDIGQ